jgi:hypothetical protein
MNLAETVATPQRTAPLTRVLLPGLSVVLVVLLMIQGFFVIPRLTAVLNDFGVATPDVFRTLASIPRLVWFAFPLLSLVTVFLGRESTRSSLIVAVVLLAANVIVLAIMAHPYLALRSEVG